MGRFGRVEDIARTTVIMASAGSKYCAGRRLRHDGGDAMQWAGPNAKV
jgi:NAD(P)-dependent dehydrogenase (short-subunit alcohol dehydrogenase family)